MPRMYTEQEVQEQCDKSYETGGDEAFDSAAQLVDSCLECDPTLIKLAAAIRALKTNAE